jgi:predicted transcriptional regulator
MKKYRSRDDIIASVLQATIEKEIRTKIMYKTYLPYQQFKEYLSILVQYQLVEHQEEEEEEQTYRITEKGRRFLEIYNQINELIAPKTQMKAMTNPP